MSPMRAPGHEKPILAAIILLLLLSCRSAHCSPGPAPESLQRAKAFTEQLRYDKALEQYRIAADAYDISLPRQLKEICFDGILGCCDIYLLQGNYTAAFEYLLLAENIARRDGFPEVKLHALFGALYIVMAQQTVNASYLHKSRYHDSIALPLALQERDDELIYRTFGDLTQCNFYFGTLGRMRPWVERMRQYATGSASWRPRVALHKYECAAAMLDHDYSKAVESYDSALTLMPATLPNSRMRAALFMNRALAQKYGKDYSAALTSIDSALTLSYRHGFKDIRLGTLPILTEVHNGMGNRPAAQQSRVHMLELRDSLRSYAIAEDLHQLELKRERSDMQAQMAVAEYRAREKDRLIIIIAIVAVIILLFTLHLRSRNRRLRQHSALLYQRMRELYRSRKETETGTQEENATARDDDGEKRKYKNSTLSEEDKNEIKASILRVMNTDAIYAQNLSLAGFSQLAGHHPKAVSQVINEVFDCNFSIYINRARIVEACRRVDMPEYAHLSMEAIGESVGFNSRTTFSVNFRNFTGLGLRAYQQTARKHHTR